MQNISPNEYLQMRINDLESRDISDKSTYNNKARISELEKKVVELELMINALAEKVFSENKVS